MTHEVKFMDNRQARAFILELSKHPKYNHRLHTDLINPTLVRVRADPMLFTSTMLNTLVSRTMQNIMEHP